MAQKIYLLTGLPGSGKSTWSRNVAENPNIIIICEDNIRLMLKGKYVFDPLYEPLVKEIAEAAFNDALMAGFDIILDEVYYTKALRAKSIDQIKNHTLPTELEIICVWFTENQNNLRYRMKESRGYSDLKWEEVITTMSQNFEIPTLDEGFDDIIEIPFKEAAPSPCEI